MSKKMRSITVERTITKREDASLDLYFNEVSKHAVLTKEEEVELFNLYTSTGDEKVLDTIVKANLKFVITVAKKFQNFNIPLGDLISDGNIGLIKAARKFDVSKGFKFISYAVWWIRQSIMESVSNTNNLIRYPSNQLVTINKTKKVIAQLEHEHHRYPSMQEIQDELTKQNIEIDINEVLLFEIKPVSLDMTLSSDTDEMKYIDVIIDENAEMPDEAIQMQEMRDTIQCILESLDPRTAEIITMFFGLGLKKEMTLKEIAKKMKLTRERVRQIKEDGLKKLRRRKCSKILKQLFI